MCVSGFSYFGGKCYKFFDTATSWDSARYQCQCQGNYDLASIASEEENNFIKSLIGANEVWIGLHDTATQNTFEWTDGTVFAYKNWDASQPNNAGGRQDCAVMRASGKWDDLICSKDYKFVCETSTSTSTEAPVSTCTTPAPTTSTVATTISIPETDKCDSGWFHSGTKCLKFFTATVTFDNARKSCKCDNEGELVSITDDARNTLVSSLAGGAEKTWIGGNDAVTEGTYTWTDGTAWSSSYTKWKNNAPNNGGTDGNQDCLSINNLGEWDDVDCATERNYVCEKAEKSSDTTTVASTTPAPSTGACACGTGWTPNFETNSCYKALTDSAGVLWQTGQDRCQV